MFGIFRNRKKFNGNVDVKVNTEYDIETRDNPRFPGIAGYLNILDNAWSQKMTEDEAAMFVATLYLCGLLKHGFIEEAELIERRHSKVTDFGIQRGTIAVHHLENCVAHMFQTKRSLGME